MMCNSTKHSSPHRRKRSVMVGGKSYHSLRSVAKAYNIPYHRVYNAAKNGYLHRISQSHTFRKLPTTWRGKTFESRSALARHLNVPVSKVIYLVKVGRIDELHTPS